MKGSWAERVALAASLAVALLFALRQNTDFDLGFHLKGGQWIWQNHSVPRFDEFTYTSNHHPYLDQHWLYQTVLYAAYRLGGYKLLTLGNAAVTLALFILLALRLRLAGVPAFFSSLLLILAAMVVEWRLEIRPELVTWLFLALLLYILDLRLLKGRNHLRWLPLLMLLWANVQALFILGFVCLACALVGGRWKDGRWDPALLKWTLISVLAVNVNPYGVRGALFFFELWRQLVHGVFAATIEEFRSPWNFSAFRSTADIVNMFTGYYGLAVGGLLLLVRRGRGRLPSEWLIWASFLFLSLTAVRNVPLFVVAALPTTGACLMDAIPERWKHPPSRFSWAVAALALLMGLRILTGAWYEREKSPTVPGLGIKEAGYPERGARYILENGLASSRPINDVTSGDWLEWRCGMKVFVDGRLEAVDEGAYLDLLYLDNRTGLKELAAKWGADLVFLDPRNSPGMPYEQLKRMPDWKLVSAEESLLIIAPEKTAQRLPVMDWDAFLRDRGVPKPGPGDAERLLAAPRIHPVLDWLEGFWRKKVYDDGLGNLGIAAGMGQRYDVAEAILLHLLKRMQGSEPRLYYNLASVYFLTNRTDLARLAYRRCWEAGIRDNIVRERAGY